MRDRRGHVLGRAVQGRLLMRVLAIAQRLGEPPVAQQRVGPDFGRGAVRAQVRADRGVVAGRVAERLDRELATQSAGDVTVLESRQHRRIVGRIDDHDDVLVVLGSGAQHGGTADVDVLDGLRIRAVRARGRRLERIQIHDQQVDDADAVLREHRVVHTAPRQQAAVDVRMERLDSPVHDLRKAGDRGDLGHRDARVAQSFCRTPRGHDLEAQLHEISGERLQALFVGDAEQGAPPRGRYDIRSPAARRVASVLPPGAHLPWSL